MTRPMQSAYVALSTLLLISGPAHGDGAPDDHSVGDDVAETAVTGERAEGGAREDAILPRADRTIEIRPGRQVLNVTHGETIRFSVNGRSFTWRFNRPARHRHFKLYEIAPSDIDVHGVQIYCVPDLYERDG